jgi:hypothetical protein
VRIPKGLKVRRLHKAFLRYHDANNWPMLREALRRMGRADLIGNGKHQLVPAYQPSGTGENSEGRRGEARPFRTQHTGLPTTPRGPTASRAQGGARGTGGSRGSSGRRGQRRGARDR